MYTNNFNRQNLTVDNFTSFENKINYRVAKNSNTSLST